MSDLRPKDYLYYYHTAIFIYIVTAIFSLGYHQSDEHFRIIEFALYKLGGNQSVDLVNDFALHLQSGLQPFLAYLFLSGFKIVGLNDPFIQMAIIRIMMGLFCLGISLITLMALMPSIKEESMRHPFILLASLLWFLPYISVRFSAETLSGILFTLAFALVLMRRNPLSRSLFYRVPWIVIGFIMGLAFECNYATIIMILGFLLWLIFLGKKSWPQLLLMLAGFILSLGVGLLADRWLYGIWILPFLNSSQLLAAIGFSVPGSQPWYYLLQEVFLNGGFIVGLIILFSLFYFWVRHFKNPVTWISMPLFVIYLFAPVKDVRFLFPFAFLIPYIIIYSSQDFIVLADKYLNRTVKNIGYYTIVGIFLLVNSIFVILFAFKPADQNTATIAHLEQQYNPQDIILVYADHSNPYLPFDSSAVRNHFYLPGNLEMYHVSHPEDVEAFYSRKDKLILLCVKKQELSKGFWVDKNKFIKVYESFPEEYFKITQNYWEKEGDALILYQYNNCRLLY